MTEIKTLIAAEETLEKLVSQVNLSQAYLSGQVFVFGANEKLGGACVLCVN